MINSINQINKSNSEFLYSNYNQRQFNVLNQDLSAPEQLKISNFKKEILPAGYFQSVAFVGSSINLLKKQPDVHCMYCNVLMLSENQQRDFISEVKHAKGKALINGLNKYKERLPKTEKKICDLLITTAENHPNCELNNLLEELIKEKGNKFLQIEAPNFDKHKKILDEIVKKAEHLTGQAKIQTDESIKNLKNSFIQRDEHALFAREKFIQEIGKYIRIEKKLQKANRKKQNTNRENLNYLETIKNKALKLPSIGTYSNFLSNVDDFIINYAGKSNKRIAQRLIRPIISSIDHVKPRKLKGEDTAANTGLACVKCNMEKNYKTLFEFIKEKPQIVHNPQNFIDNVIELIINNKFKQLYSYPAEFRETVKKESGITLNISRMEEFLKTKQKS